MVLSLETINRGSKESFFMIVHRNFVRIWHSYASISTKNNHMMTKTLYIKATICYTLCYNRGRYEILYMPL